MQLNYTVVKAEADYRRDKLAGDHPGRKRQRGGDEKRRFRGRPRRIFKEAWGV